jgi:uncharacterized protein (DUF1501 family)
MHRRDFIRGAAAVALPLSLSGYTAKALGLSPMLETLSEVSAAADRYVVLIQLQGGNDGINTVIPLDQYSQYASLRSNIALPENKILKLTNATGLHPSMTGMKALYDAGNVAVIQGVTYPGSNSSHFRSTDIWMTGADFNQYLTTGWTGRYLDSQFPEYPRAYPTKDMPDPLAIQISANPSLLLKGANVPMGVNVQDPDSFYRLVQGTSINGFDTAPDNAAGKQIAYIRQVQAQSETYAGVIKTAADKAKNLATYTPRGVNTLADQLAIVARLIAGGLKTRVYLVSLGGFDTHQQQVTATDKTIGSHATLLARLSEGITSFQQDLKMMKIDNKVVGMTFSEFGRRVASNGSNGTDHGTSAPVFVFGSAVKGGVVGANANLSDLNGGNLKMQYDFRQIYASILKQWFGTNATEYNAVLGKNAQGTDFTTLPLIQGATAAQESVAFSSNIRVQNYPNPCADNTVIEYSIPSSSHVRLSVVDASGRAIVSMEEDQLVGTYSLNFNTASLPNGTYMYQLQTNMGSAMGRMVVQR